MYTLKETTVKENKISKSRFISHFNKTSYLLTKDSSLALKNNFYEILRIKEEIEKTDYFKDLKQDCIKHGGDATIDIMCIEINIKPLSDNELQSLYKQEELKSVEDKIKELEFTLGGLEYSRNVLLTDLSQPNEDTSKNKKLELLKNIQYNHEQARLYRNGTTLEKEHIYLASESYKELKKLLE